MTNRISRRTFAKTGTAAGLGWTALSASRVYGANDRIRLGFIGVANRGGQLIKSFRTHDDAAPVAVCDVHGPTREAARKRAGGQAEIYGDFRQVLERKDVDAVVVATPDHWHAIMTIDACRAGKDVYVEKPLSKTIQILPERGGQFQDPKPRMEEVRESTPDGNLTNQHTRNFLDCVKSRQRPTADVEIGHRSTTFSHLANISLSTRLRIEWDADRERITNSEEANNLLHYEYRKPWTLG